MSDQGNTSKRYHIFSLLICFTTNAKFIILFWLRIELDKHNSWRGGFFKCG